MLQLEDSLAVSQWQKSMVALWMILEILSMRHSPYLKKMNWSDLRPEIYAPILLPD
jgi:hypothetical protein